MTKPTTCPLLFWGFIITLDISNLTSVIATPAISQGLQRAKTEYVSDAGVFFTSTICISWDLLRMIVQPLGSATFVIKSWLCPHLFLSHPVAFVAIFCCCLLPRSYFKKLMFMYLF